MPHSRRKQQGPHPRSRISLWGLRDSPNETGASGDQQSGIQHNDAAKDPFVTPVPAVLHSVRVESPRAASPEYEDVDNTLIAKRKKQQTHLSPQLKPSGPSFTSLESQIPRAHPSDDYHEQQPVDAEISIAVEELPQSPLGNTDLAAKISRKKKAIAFVKVALRVVAAGLKAAPIPNLDQIPNLLLALIQTYEVSHLARSLFQC